MVTTAGVSAGWLRIGKALNSIPEFRRGRHGRVTKSDQNARAAHCIHY